ncbi:hypothetical protein PHYSODRAFT_323150 [Phytophthora sojae]|uniref:Uncharacterized protein n=1 Tax=Phytophthora sojae (strain P6497) TaxID=1094619 RepID=G4YHS8_PHYSP|nr:hypothetical protein PHYSODRAFT_323150 [Phytophthora sojae]EGZ29655.1 hypothetical protein PHYSODRAFT_323150 [Phytophthora sojae]|eukprot:XP_009516930.1 hypothetical protein PHYSODRAFT_323150 [Phytophthora sojae]
MATSSSSSSTTEWPLRATTVVVCRECLPGALAHVARRIDAYLDSFSPCGDALVRACRRGFSLRALEYVAARENDPCREDVARAAARSGRWLWANREEVCTPLAVIGAARNGRLEMLQWLEQNVPVVQWLYPKQSDRRSSELRLALTFAARRGHEDVVHWLHSQRTLPSHVC